ncbi:MAG: V-type ATPase subunit [Methanospirillum sp.]|nr:V-type ATPase subunit [Methanospirillum sp.]
MHSFLLDKKAFDILIVRPDLDSVISELEKTLYREDLERALVTTPGIHGFENALRYNLIRTFRKILRLVEGGTGERYVRIFLAKWDIHNIKTILRGKRVHVPASEIRDYLIPSGDLDEATLNELVKQPDLKAVIDLLAVWGYEWATPLTLHFGEFTQRNDLVILEYALDQYYYQWALSLIAGKTRDEKTIRDLISTEIDVTNIKCILSLNRDGIDAADSAQVLLEGGRYLDHNMLMMMVNEPTVTGLLKYLESTPYRFLLKLPVEGKRALMSVYQNALDIYLIKQGVAVFRCDPLSVSIVIGYLWAKYNEIINLRIIGRCKNIRISLEEIERELIYV